MPLDTRISSPVCTPSLSALHLPKKHLRLKRGTPRVLAVYRWSPEKDDRRRREGLYDNAEPDTARASTADPRSSSNGRSRPPSDDQEVEDDEMEDEAPRGSPSVDAAAWRQSGWAPDDDGGGTAAAAQNTDWGWAAESWAAGFRGERGEPTSSFSSRPLDNEEADDYGPEGNAFDEASRGDRRASRGPRVVDGRGGPALEDAFVPGDATEPDVVILSQKELDRVLPVVPFSQQAAFFNGTAADAVQRWGASLGLTVVLSKAALLAAASLTWPLWWPWARAASKNYSVRQKLRCAGLWRTQILEVHTGGRPKPAFGAATGGVGTQAEQSRRNSTMRTTRFLVGDPDGAQTEVVLPFDSRHDLIAPGLPAELLVLAPDASFASFKAVKDVFLPNSGFWLSEYPYLDRTEFLEISLEVEREAQAAQEGGYGGGRRY